LRIGDILVVNEDLRDGELRHCRHPARTLLIHGTSEFPRPVEGIEKPNYDVPSDCFFDTLEARSATQKLL
jgi:hypothetical protein